MRLEEALWLDKIFKSAYNKWIKRKSKYEDN